MADDDVREAARHVLMDPGDRAAWDHLLRACTRDRVAPPPDATMARVGWLLRDAGGRDAARSVAHQMAQAVGLDGGRGWQPGASAIMARRAGGDTRRRLPTDSEVARGAATVMANWVYGQDQARQATMQSLVTGLRGDPSTPLSDYLCQEVHDAASMVYGVQVRGAHGATGWNSQPWHGPDDGAWFGLQGYRGPISGIIRTRLTVGQARCMVANFAEWNPNYTAVRVPSWSFDPMLAVDQAQAPAGTLGPWPGDRPFVVVVRHDDGLVLSVDDQDWPVAPDSRELALLVASRASTQAFLPDASVRELARLVQ